MTLDSLIENEIDTHIEAKHEVMDREFKAVVTEETQYNFDEEMENAEDPCCDECAFWNAYALKHSLNRNQLPTH